VIILYSDEFLNKLFTTKTIKKIAKVIRLDIDDKPIEEVTGRITSGSLNLDGKSNVQRTCSLSMVVLDKKESNAQWAITSRFRLEIALINEIDAT